MTSCFYIDVCVCFAGVQTEGLFHRDAGSSVKHGGGFLENGLGVEVSLDRNADRTTGARSGTHNNAKPSGHSCVSFRAIASSFSLLVCVAGQVFSVLAL